MFVKVSGFGHGSGIFLPQEMRRPPSNTNTKSVVLALIRWLSPHRRATERDDEHRPICPAPFGINHALWEFTKLTGRRKPFNNVHDRRQLDLFPGLDERTRRRNADNLSRARLDLVQIQTLEKFMNCTRIDNTSNILETITLPF